MKKLLIPFLLLLTYSVHAQTPLKRADCFFGLGFDFNADSITTNIGYGLHAKDVDSLLSYIKPDFIQVDTKGDYGYASYPSKIGASAPQIVQNPLPVFRTETSKYGVGLYAHYCALYDGAAAKNHPTWGRLKANGLQDSLAVSLFSPYVTDYFIPELKEISSYGLDGLWIDSDSWVLLPDYSAYAASAYGKPLPLSYADTAMHSYISFTRQAYHNYLNNYVNTLHAFNPELQICSSWAYAYMLGPVDSKVDFLSGDLNSDDPNEFEYHARLLGSQGLPWDLMEWVKPTTLPLQKNAAIILAQGGAVQIYMVQNRDASLPTIYNPQVKGAADFCRARKAYCFKTAPIPQVVVFISSYGYNKEASSIFSISEGNLSNVKAMMSLYLNLHYSVQILQEHEFNSDLNVYPLIIIPGWQDIEPSFLVKLKQYVKNGGKLLITGTGANNLFSDVELKYTVLANSMHLPVLLYKYGSGTIIGIPFDLYSTTPNPEMAAFEQTLFTSLTTTLFPAPIITVTGTGNYHINATTKNNEKIFHFVNMNNSLTGPLNTTLRLTAAPSAVLLQPGNKKLVFTYLNGICNVTVPAVSVYTMLEIKN